MTVRENLELGAYRYGLAIPDWFAEDRKSFDQPRNRYATFAHFDLHEWLTNNGASRFTGGLSLAATLIGKPGKLDVAGHMVQDLWDAGKKAEIDARVAKEKGGLIGAAMVSDAFFPFRDGVEVGIREGIRSVIQPGGSENDYQVIEACNEADVAMVFTGQRSFKH